MSNNQSTPADDDLVAVRATNIGAPITPETENDLRLQFVNFSKTFFSAFFYDIQGSESNAADFLEECCYMLHDSSVSKTLRLTRFKWRRGEAPELHWIYTTGARKTSVDDIGVRRIIAEAYKRAREPDEPVVEAPKKASQDLPTQADDTGATADAVAVAPPPVILKSKNDARLIAIYDAVTVRNKLDDEKQIASNDRRAHLVKLYELMLRKGEMRPTKLAPPIKVIRELADRFPNFSEVVELLAASAALSNLGHSAFKFPPLLLLGPPGIGKTYFATTLATIAHVNFKIVSMETTSAGWVLSGMHRGWAGAGVGKVAETLVHGNSGNPIIVLDEVDKAAHGKYDTLAPLYGLLEEKTAAEFEDEFLNLPVDASCINWILTANDLSRVPEPIVSRMTVVNIPSPNPEQIRHVVRQIYADMRGMNFWGSHFSAKLSDGAVDLLATVSPRQVRQWLRLALGRAAEEKRRNVKVADLLAMQPTERVSAKRPIGFTVPGAKTTNGAFH
jgi:ATP-dependent Lon protease